MKTPRMRRPVHSSSPVRPVPPDPDPPAVFFLRRSRLGFLAVAACLALSCPGCVWVGTDHGREEMSALLPLDPIPATHPLGGDAATIPVEGADATRDRAVAEGTADMVPGAVIGGRREILRLPRKRHREQLPKFTLGRLPEKPPLPELRLGPPSRSATP